jgi:hypothetical protein
LPCPAPKADITVGDETMTMDAVTIAALAPAQITDALLPAKEGRVIELLEARKTLARLRPILLSEQPLAALRDAHLDAGLLRKLHLELAEEPDADFDGTMSDDAIDTKLNALDHPERRSLLAIVAAILREIEQPRATFNAVRYDARHDRIRAAHLRFIGVGQTAVLLLDGTGDPVLNEKLARRGVAHNVVRMERDAMVTGTIGKRYSRQSITGILRRKNEKTGQIEEIPVRAEAAQRLRDEISQVATQYPDALLTATKDAEEALVEGGHLPADIVTSHHGATRGVNSFEHRPAAIDAGAESISIDDAELLAGAFFATDPAPIVSMGGTDAVPENWPYGPWPYRATRLRRMRNGLLQAVQVDVHPDPRVQRIIEQIREAGAIQNLDRVRPIYNQRHLVAMNELVLDLTYDRVYRHRELVEGGSRIDRILKHTDGVLPLTPALLSALFPGLAGSASTARRAVRAWRRNWGHNPYRSSLWDLTPVEFRQGRTAGQPSVAMVSTHHPDLKAALEAVVGPVTTFREVVRPQPAQPQAAAPPPKQGGQRPDRGTGAPPPWQRPPGGGPAVGIWQARAPPDD